MDEELIRSITSATTEVHHLLDEPGLIETVNEAALCHELSLRGIPSQRHLVIPVVYQSTPVREPTFLDILVERRLITRLKQQEKIIQSPRTALHLHEVHRSKTRTTDQLRKAVHSRRHYTIDR